MMICIFRSKKGVELEGTECGSTGEEDSKSSIDMSEPYYNPRGLNWYANYNEKHKNKSLKEE